ncbi:ATP-binding cassette domain-containing protein [Candidatus Margulisiibacteriota bacterium]
MLKAENICKQFKNFSLKNLSIEVAQGEYMALIGPSGSGKTIFLEILAGVQKEDSGKIFLSGNEITNHLPENRNIGLLYQNFMLFNHLTVFDNIAFSLKIKKEPPIKLAESVKKIAALLRIEDLLERYPKNLSGGEKQRVALARSLIMEPKILLLDEPFSAIDAHLRKTVVSEIKKLHKSLNLTVIHVTHDIDEALYLADSISIINKGKIIQKGNKEQVFKDPQNKFAADFLGYKNIFKGRIRNNNEFIIDLNATGNKEIAITLDSTHHHQEAYLLIPPESIIVSKSANPSSARNQFKGVVSEVIQKKGFYEIIIDLGVMISVYITSESLTKLNLEESSNCFISFKATALKLF